MNIDKIRQNIVGDYGLASSNQYHISFELNDPVTNNTDSTLSSFMFNRGFTMTGSSSPEFFGKNDTQVNNALKLSFLADEVNIPGYSIATGDFKGSVPGINIRYAHTKNYSEMNVAFLMDMDHTPLKFLRLWSDFMFGFESSLGVTSSTVTPTIYAQMQYYNYYTKDIIIDKLEPNTSSRTKVLADSSYDTHNVITRTRLHNAYQYLINDVTVSNAPNQPLRLQTTFYYEYFTTETLRRNRVNDLKQ